MATKPCIKKEAECGIRDNQEVLESPRIELPNKVTTIHQSGDINLTRIQF